MESINSIPQAIVATIKDNGKTITVNQGEIIHIILPVALSSDQTWSYNNNKQRLLTPIDEPKLKIIHDEKNNKLSKQENIEWMFLAKKMGTVNLIFTYKHLSQRNENPEKSFHISINILKNQDKIAPYVQWEGGEESFGKYQYY